jgi:hypothetical protein
MIVPDTTLDAVKTSDFDMLFLPSNARKTNLKPTRVIGLVTVFDAAVNGSARFAAAPTVLQAAVIVDVNGSRRTLKNAAIS